MVSTGKDHVTLYTCL